MITIKKYNQTYYFDKDSSTIEEIFNDNYKIFAKGVVFEPNDIVIDIGANIGAFSIMLAKLYPFIKVYSVEPVAETYIQLLKNIELNNLTNIIPINVALSDGYDRVKEIVYSDIDSGGASSFVTERNPELYIINVGCITLGELFKHYSINKCKLLKLDCEGAEYEIIYSSHMLNIIEYVVGEFHENSELNRLGYTPDKLAHFISTRVKHMLYFESCIMHE